MVMKFVLVVFFLFVSLLHAYDDLNNSSEYEKSYIDITHEIITGTVHEWAVDIDGAILGIYNFLGGDPYAQDYNISTPLDVNNTDVNTSYLRVTHSVDVNITDSNLSLKNMDSNESNQSLSKELTVKDKQLTKRDKVDEFFLTRKLLEERDKSFVRVSYIYGLNSIEDTTNNFSVRAKLGLGRSKKRLKLFIEDLDDDSAKNIGSTNVDDSPAIGVELFRKKRFGIKPRYSIGFRGIDPFARARYSYETDFGRWHFEPVQTFLYSIDDEFSEITELYLDTPVSDRTLLRFVLDRGTKSRVNGMHYDGFIQYFWKPRKHRALSVNLGFNGSTKYENIIVDSDPPVIKEENKVFNYLFLMRWRENFWKEWLFYEVAPGVNYHESNDYRPNYSIYFRIDMFFGHI